MQLFLDTANLQEIARAMAWGVIDGVTTNPTLVAREGGDYFNLLQEICRLVPGPVSAEVMAEETEAMLIEARQLAALAPQIVIKIPLTPDGLTAVRLLREEGIRCNVTLVFSFNQALLAAKSGAAYVSPFLGRLDDLGQDGAALVTDICSIFRHYHFDCAVIAASIRHPLQLVQVARAGAQICTVPFAILEKLFHHPLTAAGLARFRADWEKRSP